MRRGFTLIEVTISIAVMALITTGFLAWALGLYRTQHVVFTQADVETEGARAVAVLQRHLKHPGFKLDADNAGMRCADGSVLRLRDNGLWLGSRRLFSYPVQDLCLVHDEKTLTMTVTLDVPRAAFDQAPQPLRLVYDFEVPQ